MNSYILNQEDLIERIKKALVNYKKSPKERLTVSHIESRKEIVESWLDTFESTHSKIVGGTDRDKKADVSYFKQELYYEFQDIYFEYITKLKEDLKRLKETRVPNIDKPVAIEVKLPQIHLPKFTGNYDEWQTFNDMFVALIHENKALSPVQKLHYLKGCLSGEAEQLLKNYSSTDSNYTDAYEHLKRRFTNKRFNCHEALKRLFSQKSLSFESASGLNNLVDTTASCLKTLDNLGIETKSWDAIVNYLIITKLDNESRKLWELHVGVMDPQAELPTLSDLTTFLETRFRTLEMLDGGKGTGRPYQVTKPYLGKKAFHSSAIERKQNIQINEKVCAICNGAHVIEQCKQFENITPQERTEQVKSKGLCFNCFSPTHAARRCWKPACCHCGRRHHSLLHYDGSMSQAKEVKAVAHFASESNKRVLLATAIIRVKSGNGHSLTVRALIDQGSEISFVTESVVQALRIKKTNVNGTVSGIGEGQTRIKNMVSVKVESLHNAKFYVNIQAYVLKKLTSFLPATKTLVSDWPIIETLTLADPKYGVPGKIDMILGADVYGAIMLEGLLKHPSMTGPIAQNSQFGWILSGSIAGKDVGSFSHSVSLHTHVKEDELLRQFWEIEREPDLLEKRMTKEELRCEEFYEETTTRDDNGRYIVRLPFRSFNPECVEGKSMEISMRRLKQLENKLSKDTRLYEQYREVIEDYVEQGHAELIEKQEEIENTRAVYLPHHAVVREEKETTKVRVVFDASCKGVNHVSLNDDLLIGPKLQPDLRHTLMRWRRHVFCIVADLKQMYRQIKVDARDTDYQRILWRPHKTLPVQHYRLLRLTFGTACAPYLAVKTLQQLANDNEKNYPIASTITKRDYYMDDLLSGCEDEEGAIKIYNEMNELMKLGGFELQKWNSNCNELLNHISKGMQVVENKTNEVIFSRNDTIKVLGIVWNKHTDNFGYRLQLPESSVNITKRKILSDIARLYDPLGWIAPIIIKAKIFIQKLWKSGLNWDDELTEDLKREWQFFRDGLGSIRSVTIPRWLRTRRRDHVELHVFADASQAGYAAAVYLKSETQNGLIEVNLVTAKTKVAPVEKEISIPRMELCAALLGAKLIFEVSQIMDIRGENLRAWSDSTVVLAWLAGEPSRWTTFVSNRVSEILTMLNRDQWSHVSTHQNPADYASRGTSVDELINNNLWWHGPDWLRTSNFTRRPCESFKTDEEAKPIRTLMVISQKENFIWLRFSKLSRMLRVLAYCRRVLYYKTKKDERPKDLSLVVTAEEREEVLKCCIKETQKFYFEDDMKNLKMKKCVSPKSKLLNLNPFIDDKGILRVNGRIHDADVGFDKRHPIILPSESYLTKLIVEDAHIKSLHGGPQLMLNLLRSKFWIIRARQIARKCFGSCVKCVRYSKKNNNPLMGQIPDVRLKPIRTFKKAGVDFTGHINIRFSPGRGSKSYKGYICIFVCMFTKAIHLEAVSELSAQGFIAAFRRFVSRRGHCQTLYSDNGTNFVGASKELKTMLDRSVSEVPDEIGKLLANDATTWSFIPPHAPNFGGLWEAGVRSAKTHLRRVVGDSTLTFEELSTLLTQIEACLNSRPLSYLSSSSEDPVPLTPGHFLVGEPLIILPDENYDNKNISSLQRWKYIQKLMRDFWNKWSEEYLVTLHQRQKWNVKRPEPEIGDIVILRDFNTPPAKWLLGKIVEKYTGKDDITRVVNVRTKNGLYKRPCNKLCFLPKSDSDV